MYDCVYESVGGLMYESVYESVYESASKSSATWAWWE